MYVPRQAQKSHFIKNIYLEEAETNDLFSYQAQAFSTFHPHSKFSFEKLDLSCRNVIKVCMMNRPTDMSTFVLDSLRRNGSFSFPHLQNFTIEIFVDNIRLLWKLAYEKQGHGKYIWSSFLKPLVAQNWGSCEVGRKEKKPS